jgi:hypothetical protein
MTLKLNLLFVIFEFELLFIKGPGCFTLFRILLTVWKHSVFLRVVNIERNLRTEVLSFGFNLNYGKIFKRLRWETGTWHRYDSQGQLRKIPWWEPTK